MPPAVTRRLNLTRLTAFPPLSLRFYSSRSCTSRRGAAGAKEQQQARAAEWKRRRLTMASDELAELSERTKSVDLRECFQCFFSVQSAFERFDQI